MGARNRVGIGLLYRPARLYRLAEVIPRLLNKSFKIPSPGSRAATHGFIVDYQYFCIYQTILITLLKASFIVAVVEANIEKNINPVDSGKFHFVLFAGTRPGAIKRVSNRPI
jgi:hypothetical protein